MNRTVISEFCDEWCLLATLQHNGISDGSIRCESFIKIWLNFDTITSMKVNGEYVQDVEIEVEGVSQRKTLLDALKMFVKELEENQ